LAALPVKHKSQTPQVWPYPNRLSE
jgi:hypothetical protein